MKLSRLLRNVALVGGISTLPTSEAVTEAPAIPKTMSKINDKIQNWRAIPNSLVDAIEFLGLSENEVASGAEVVMREAGLSVAEIKRIQQNPRAYDLNFLLFFVGFGLLLSADVGVGLAFMKKEDVRKKMILLLSIPSFHFLFPLLGGGLAELGLESNNALAKVFAYLLGAGGLVYLLKKTEDEDEPMISSTKDALVFAASVSVDALASGSAIAVESDGKFLAANSIQAVTVAVATLGALMVNHIELIRKLAQKIDSYGGKSPTQAELSFEKKVEDVAEVMSRSLFGAIAVSAGMGAVKEVVPSLELPEIPLVMDYAITLLAGYFLQKKLAGIPEEKL